jgi:hypothetical protein
LSDFAQVIAGLVSSTSVAAHVRCRVVFVRKLFMVAVRDRFGMTVSAAISSLRATFLLRRV